MRCLRALAFAVVVGLWATPAHATFTFHASAGGGGTGSSGTVAVAAATTVGDLVMVMVSFEGFTTTCSASNGTSSLTAWGPGVTAGSRGSEPWLCAFYKLSSDVGSTPTYTVTFGANRTYRNIVVMTYTPSAGSVVLDGTAAGNSGGPGTTVTSSNITTTSNDGVVFSLYGNYGGPVTLPITINGTTVEQGKEANPASGLYSALFALRYAAGFTGNGSTALSASAIWTAGIIAFKLRPPAGCHASLALLGVGC